MYTIAPVHMQSWKQCYAGLIPAKQLDQINALGFVDEYKKLLGKGRTIPTAAKSRRSLLLWSARRATNPAFNSGKRAGFTSTARWGATPSKVPTPCQRWGTSAIGRLTHSHRYAEEARAALRQIISERRPVHPTLKSQDNNHENITNTPRVVTR
jgi:hypothetical protein